MSQIIFANFSRNCFLFNIPQAFLEKFKASIKTYNGSIFTISKQPSIYLINNYTNKLDKKNILEKDSLYLFNFSSIEESLFTECKNKYLFYGESECLILTPNLNKQNIYFDKAEYYVKTNDPLEILNKYLDQRYTNYYPKILIPERIKKAFLSKPEYVQNANQYTELSLWAGVLGATSLLTPIGWIGAIGAGIAILYDATEGYQSRQAEVDRENQRIQAILTNPDELKKYMQNNIINNVKNTYVNLDDSDAKQGLYDYKLIKALEEIPDCIVKSGLGLFGNGYHHPYTPDAIIHVPKYNLWIDVELDEPWYKENGERIPSHCVDFQKDCQRDKFFLEANWVVIRFAEEQVIKQPKSCAKEIAQFLRLFDLKVDHNFRTTTILKRVECWTSQEALNISRNISRD